MTPQELKNAVIEKKVVVATSASDVYSRWTTSEGLKTFFGRENQIELKVFGKFEIYFLLDAPEGSRGSEGCQILSFVPNELFSFTWNAPPHLEARHSGIYTYVVVMFREVSSTQTEVLIRHLGWPEDSRYPEVYDYFENAWGFVADNLVKAFQ